MNDQKFKYCSECGAKVDISANFCGHCGSEKFGSCRINGTKICLRCGGKNKASSKFCTDCRGELFVDKLSDYYNGVGEFTLLDDGTYSYKRQVFMTAGIKDIRMPGMHKGKLVSEIEDFSHLPNLKKVVVPDSVIHIADSAFEDCKSLTDIALPDSIKTIGANAFAGCRSLTDITLPLGLQRVRNSTFMTCVSLKSITIPRSVEYIEDFVFVGCKSLVSIVLPDNLKYMGYSNFDYCESLSEVYYMGTEKDWSNIKISNHNDALFNATRYYYSTTKPTANGNYWHYDEDGVTPVKWA